MRRKKHKHTRKAIQFYRINHGFRPPFKVILDGNFVHALAALKRADAQQELEHLLGDKARLFTTKCVMQELKALGKEFSATRNACKGHALHLCGHEEAVTAAECLAAQVEGGNAEHFLVATQDRALQRRVMAAPGGAAVFVSVNGVHLEMPSALQKSHVAKIKAERMGAGALERGSASLRELAEAEAGPPPKERAVFRSKKAKGPNPLAVRPKQKKAAPAAVAAAAGQQGPAAQAGGEEPQRKRSRPRRRKPAAAGDAD